MISLKYVSRKTDADVVIQSHCLINRLSASRLCVKWLPLSSLFIGLCCASVQSYAGPTELVQAKRIHERLTGAPPLLSVLKNMETELLGTDTNADGITGGEGAARIAMEDDNFYRVTLRNWVAPWTNRNGDVFVPLNDYTTTVMGYVKDDRDFRGILSDDVLYVGSGVTPAYSAADNEHYVALQETDPQTFNLKDSLTASTQTPLTGVPPLAVAGVMTSRAAAKAFFVDGTNRAMLRFTLINHLCTDLEQLQDPTIPPDRVRQDVSRSPGGDSRIFSNTCVTCHGGMDPMAQAFAYYDYDNDGILNIDGSQAVAATDRLIYNEVGAIDIDEKTNEASNEPDPNFPDLQRVQRKNHINENTFPLGYRTTDDGWSNYWRTGVNRSLGWDGDDGSVRSGNGAKSLGQELANSDAFAQCQVKKVFQSICLRDPINTADLAGLDAMTNSFKTNGYKLKQTFAEVANYCKGN